MRIEIVPNYPLSNAEPPYPTAQCEIGYKVWRLAMTPGTDEEVLTRASQKVPEGRNFVLEENQDRYRGAFVAVQYERPWNRWFVEVSTVEELMAILDDLSPVEVEGAVISTYGD